MTAFTKPTTRRPFYALAVAAVASLLAAAAAAAGASAAEIDFNRDVRPILSNNCFLCHGPDESSLEAGLRLDLRDSAVKPLDSGATAIVPGEPDKSELIARVTSDDEFVRMPPPEHGAKLSQGELSTLRQWISEGAKYARHWSYIKPERPPPPVPPQELAGWPRNPIDHFALRRMLEHDLQPSTEAGRYALVRRVFLDLTGLPPTVAEADAFAQSDDPDAYEKLVDDLLRRPSFGEHWARKWLDLARYADSAGYADDPARTIWAYRDWVIRAMNDNMPFDQFTIEQLAGDLLPEPTIDQLIATAFHRNTLTNNEGGTQDEEFRNVAVVDRVNTTMAVWMGTTMGCAQCHSHKYDPISQEEYFRFFSILNNTQDADRRDESPRVDVFTETQLRQKAELQQRIDALQKIIATPTPALEASQAKWERRLRSAPQWTSLRPAFAERASDKPVELEDGAVLLQEPADRDTTTALVPLAQGAKLAAIRIQSLPRAELPGGGAGLSGGNFVVSSVQAQFRPAGESAPQARFVRITNNGQQQILSLAEVQVVSGGENIAGEGKAKQHSTDYDGPPELAIDGNTDGNFEATSVTHTKTAADPWWELDLQSAKPVDQVVIWNRTDNNLHTRLQNFTIELLDAKRAVVWSRQVKEPPHPQAAYQPSDIRTLRIQSAAADYSQPGFPADAVLDGKADTGWAVGGKTAESHQLVLTLKDAFEVDEPGSLRLTIGQQSTLAQHLLGHFRIDVTDDEAAIERSRLPSHQLAILDKDEAQRSDEERASLGRHYREQVAPELRTQRSELAAAEQQLAGMKPATSVPVLRELTSNHRTTNIQHRGNYLDKGAEVEPGLPSAFHAAPEDTALDRLALARWLVSPENPLTARVLVNRYWESLFGRGIVETSEEFGSQGEPPSHPQLLDWLATELMRSGWDRKALLRLIVTSATYRQSAKFDPAAADPGNRWLSRGPRIRLTAEMVRDQALFAGGLLSHKMYGPPVRPPQPNLGLTAAFGSSTDWKTSQGEDRYRRGIYTTWRRSNPYPSMATFDAPNREVCTVRRNRTNTPLQSLVTLNDPVYVEAAQSLARLTLQQDDASAEERLTYAFRRCLLRPPRDVEVVALRKLYEDARQGFEGREEEAKQLATDPLGPLPDGMDSKDAAAMTVVGNVLLNLDEMFLKR